MTVGEQTLEVMHLRGHTPGSIALVWRGPDGAGVHVFTGDSLFPGGVGNTQQDPARFASLIDDVEQRLFAAFPTRRGSTPGTARTRRSAPSARTSASGASGAGEPGSPAPEAQGSRQAGIESDAPVGRSVAPAGS